MYNKETLNKWNMTEDECEKAINQIKIPDMRLTHDEKEELIWYIMEGITKEDDYEGLRAHIEFSRKLAKEFEEDKKLVRQFVKEWKRLEKKYDMLNSDIKDKSLDELTEMWLDNYFEINFMERFFDLIKYHGAKEYAQVYCYNIGVCPESEVSMWN